VEYAGCNSKRGRRFRLYYLTQIGVCPPTFALFVNKADAVAENNLRHVINKIRQVFGFEGTPIRLIVRESGEGREVRRYIG